MAAAQAERTKREQIRESEGRKWESQVSLCSSADDIGSQDLDALLLKLAWYKRAISKAAGRDGGRPLQEWQQSIALARYTAETVLSATGHKALRGTQCVQTLFPSFVPFGTEPLLVNTD